MFRNYSHALNRLLSVQEALEAASRADYFGTSTTSRGGNPSVNIFQNGEDVVLTAEIPGVKKDDVNIEVKENLIRISGERKVDYPENSSKHRIERRGVRFDRTLKLPVRVETERVRAEYNNGILKVILPRAEKDKPKQIKVA